MSKRKQKIFLAAVFLTVLAGFAAAQNVQVDGLSQEDINASWTGDGVQFQTSYLNKTVDYEKVFLPDDLGTKDQLQTEVKEKNDSLQVEIKTFEVQDSDYPSIDGDKFSGKIDIKKGEVKSSFVNGSLVNDAGTYTIDVSSDSHFEHLLLDYQVLNSTNGVENEAQNVYSGEKPELLAVDYQINKYDDTEHEGYVDRAGINYDNSYRGGRTVNVTVVFPENKSFLGLNTPSNNYSEIDSQYSSVVDSAHSAGKNSTLLESTEGFTIKSFEVEVRENEKDFISFKVPSEKGESNDLRMWLEGSFAGGSGTSEDPYEISNCNEWNNIDIETNMDDSFELVDNLDCGNGQLEPVGFNSSGDNNGAVQYTGTFDGNGYNVSNFEMSYPNYRLIALFSEPESGSVIKNINIQDGYFYSFRAVGAVGGRIQGGTVKNINIEDSKIEATTELNYYAGSFSGHLKDGEVSNIRVKNTDVVVPSDAVSHYAAFTGETEVANTSEIILAEMTNVTFESDAIYGASGPDDETGVYYDEETVNWSSSDTGYGTALTTSEMTGTNALDNMPELTTNSWTEFENEYPRISSLLPNEKPDSPSVNSPADGSSGTDNSVNLEVSVSDPDGDSMDVTFYDASDDSQIGSTQTGVADGGTASVTWSNLTWGTSYSWYAVADDGSATTTSSTWSFETNYPPTVSDIQLNNSNIEYGDTIHMVLKSTDTEGFVSAVRFTGEKNGSTVFTGLNGTQVNSTHWRSDPIKVNESDAWYNITADEAEDDKGAITTNGTELSHYVDNAPPLVQQQNAWESFQKDFSNSYCGRDTVTQFGDTSQEYQVSLPNGSTSYKLYVARIKNSNTLDVKVNQNSIGSLGSTSGSDCNGDNWVVKSFEVDSTVADENTNITFTPSGSDNNYIDLVAFRENTSTGSSLYREDTDLLILSEWSDPEGSFDKLKYNTGKGVFDQISESYGFVSAQAQSVDGNETFDFTANDTAGLSNSASTEIEIDALNPVFDPITGPSSIVLDHNESSKTEKWYSNVTDEHLDSTSCLRNGLMKTSGVFNDGTSDYCEFTVEEADAGNETIGFYGKDKVGHENQSEETVRISDVDYNTTEESTVDTFYVGSNYSSENVNREVLPRFALSQTFDVAGTADGTSQLFKELETENVDNSTINVSLGGESKTVDWDPNSRKVSFTHPVNGANNSDYTETGEIEWNAGDIDTYWQNDGSVTDKRYFRVNSEFSYNYTLEEKFKFESPVQWDQSSEHVEVYECTDPSTSDRYSCSGNWDRVDSNESAEGVDEDGDGNADHVPVQTTFSDNLFYTVIEDGSEESSDDTGGTVVGGGSDDEDTDEEPVEEESEYAIRWDHTSMKSSPGEIDDQEYLVIKNYKNARNVVNISIPETGQCQYFYIQKQGGLGFERDSEFGKEGRFGIPASSEGLASYDDYSADVMVDMPNASLIEDGSISCSPEVSASVGQAEQLTLTVEPDRTLIEKLAAFFSDFGIPETDFAVFEDACMDPSQAISGEGTCEDGKSMEINPAMTTALTVVLAGVGVIGLIIVGVFTGIFRRIPLPF